MSKNANVKAVLENSLPLLKVSFGTNEVETPGQFFPRQQAGPDPEIKFNAVSSTGRYVLLNIDLDAPFISLPILSPVMHLILPDLTSGVTKDDAGYAVLAQGSDVNKDVSLAPKMV
jgi:phosphatidylethanolamine-binding protein (PEBP) family uncharacterized protein